MLFKRCRCEDPSKCLHSYWYKFNVRGKHHRGTTKTANARLADRVATSRKAALIEEREGLTKIKPTRLSTQIDDYCEFTAKTNTTADKDRPVLERLQDVTGDRYLTEITGFQIETWKRDRSKEVSKSTVNRELNIIRGCFSRAVKWGRLLSTPLKDVANFDVDDHRIRTLDADELRTLLAIEDPFVTLICRMSLQSLGRISALLGLRREHIGAAWIETRLKGGRVQRVPVTPELRTELLARVHGVSGLVFGEGARGHAPTQQTASNRVLRALANAGIPDASHHTMRHTGVTMMLEQGVNPRVIQTLAGWSSLRMLERYGHTRDAESMRAVRSVATLLEDASKVGTESGTAEAKVIDESTDAATA